jgi:hypothetical protein
MFKDLIIVVFALVCLIPARYAEANEPGADQGFPRLGAMLAFQEDVARLDLAVFQFLPTFNIWTDTTIAEVLGRIKSMNPQVTLLQYVILNEQYLDSEAWPGVGRKLDAETWWLYKSGASGEIVSGEGNTRQGEANYTRFGPRDLNGLSYPQWFANWSYEVYFENVPQWDGIFVDNFWIMTRHNGDWDRDGSTDSRGSDTVARWHREGMADFIRAVSAKLPGKLMTGNIGEWGRFGEPNKEYENLMDGGFLEHYIGQSWSPEGRMWNGDTNHWGSWDIMMEHYRRTSSRVKNPSTILFDQLGRIDDYQSFRYGFASCLMGDAHYSFTNQANGYYKSVEWFDEYDLAGTATTKWLGRAIDPPQSSAWKEGVYRRRFENGMVLVNPRGNGERVIGVESGYERFLGRQDPLTNNGEPVTSIRLSDRDAIFLVRSGTSEPVKRPKPPVLQSD